MVVSEIELMVLAVVGDANVDKKFVLAHFGGIGGGDVWVWGGLTPF